MKKKISIITCTYNSEKYLPECLESILREEIDPDIYEHIIIDGCSTDNTEKVIQNYIETNPCKNIQFVKKDPKGVYNALNEGIKQACGEYICFVNSDDFFEKGALRRYIENIEKKNNIDIFHGDLNFIHGNTINRTNLNKLYHLRFFLASHGFHCLLLFPSLLIKKKVFDTIGLFDETKKVSSDFGLWLKIFQNKISIQFMPYVIANFRVHEASISSGKYKNLGIEEMIQLRKEYLGFKGIIINTISYIWFKISGNYM